ncbi:MAG: response regulator transcription factor [Syntrophobacteraceae bacterium]|jgi:two-component system phosphate regulon response regulator PhoB|nr:response regulator transcription factor [Syntrophobacteraceae bacterium]
MSKMKIVVVEDDKDILQLLAYNMQASGFEVLTSRDGFEALTVVRQSAPDLVILDLMLPNLDGFEVCKELKRDPETKHIPILMLTARGEEVDRIVGLELGADDYVVKPFSPRELILRVRAILRRSTSDGGTENFWQHEGLRVDFEGHKASLHGEEIALTATEFKLLVELVKSRGKVQTRDQLLDKVWGYHFEGYARTVDTHVRRLRQKLGVYSEWVETVRGVGYRFRV